MQRITVKSSNIRSIGYDEQLSILEVEFISGHIYHYFDVPHTLYQNLMQAASHGQFLNNNIKYSYRYQKVN